MATSRIAPVTDFEVESGERTVKAELVDDDDFPLSSVSCIHSRSNFLEHPESDEEVDSDFLSDSGSSEADTEGESEDEEELETDESIWIEELTTRTDVDFNQAVGMAVDPASLNSRNDSFQLFITDQVWQLRLICMQNRREELKKIQFGIQCL